MHTAVIQTHRVAHRIRFVKLLHGANPVSSVATSIAGGAAKRSLECLPNRVELSFVSASEKGNISCCQTHIISIHRIWFKKLWESTHMQQI